MGCDIHPYAEVLTDSGWKKADVEVPSDRNYWAFSLLAGVRNGAGFAGSDTGKPVTPISEPRGLPEDTSIADSDDDDFDSPSHVWLGDHSYSWVTLAELMAIDQSAPIERHAVAKPEDIVNYAKIGTLPEEMYVFTSRPGYAPISYQSTVAQSAFLIQKMIDALSHLGDPSKVRIVFGFDS